MIWVQFIVSSFVIVVAGIRLTKYTDQLSDHYHWGKAWIGIVLLGFITSLPEAITCVVAVISLQADDLAIGNLIGSNNFNPMLVVVMDLIYRKTAITNIIHPHVSHQRSAFFAVILTGLVGLQITFQGAWAEGQIFSLSLISWAIVVIYFLGMRHLKSLQERDENPMEETTQLSERSVSHVWMKLVVMSVLVVGGAMVLANSADMIADITGLGRTFVGNIFLALVTSLPEMVVTIQALKMGSFDLALGNIFGSNMTNMVIVSICDFFSPASILNLVTRNHAFPAFTSIALTFIILIGLKKQEKKPIAGLGWDSWLMCGIFLSVAVVLYYFR